MRILTDEEHNLIYKITCRLDGISSPVFRMQAILQFSQHVDMLYLGDTSKEKRKEMMNIINELQERVNKYEDIEDETTGEPKDMNIIKLENGDEEKERIKKK